MLWTKKKERNTRRGQQHLIQANCDNCGNAEEETKHLIVSCIVAQALWRRLTQAVNACNHRSHIPIKKIETENIFFNHEEYNHQGRPDNKEQMIKQS